LMKVHAAAVAFAAVWPSPAAAVQVQSKRYASIPLLLLCVLLSVCAGGVCGDWAAAGDGQGTHWGDQ
jgi:hypothetical protein